MNAEASSQAAELNAEHGDVDPSHGTGLCGFVIAHESPLMHRNRLSGHAWFDPAVCTTMAAGFFKKWICSATLNF